MSSALISREITSIDILSHNARTIQMSLTSHSYIIAC